MVYRIAELAGPSGAGKSTIYNHLKKRWKKSDTWVPFEYLLSRAPAQHSNLAERLRSFERSLRKAPQPSRLHEAEVRFVRSFPEYASCVWDLINSPDSNSAGHTRFINAHWFMTFFRKYQAVIEALDGRLCVFDEGLVSAIMQIPANDPGKLLLSQYVAHMPVPSMLVVVTGEPKIIAAQALQRKRISTVHVGLDPSAVEEKTRLHQEQINFIAEALEKKGASKHLVSGKMRPADVAMQIEKILSEFS